MDSVEFRFSLFTPPYRDLASVREPIPPSVGKGPLHGVGLVWELGSPPTRHEITFAKTRAPGVALLMVLPPADRIQAPDQLLRVVEVCRPHSILPHHASPDPSDLRSVLSRPPDDLPGQVTDYLGWRGLTIDLETRRLVRKTIEMSGELSTVNGLARALYVSRRALGRRFTSRGLPVPSHWLHFARVLRAAMRLQDSEDTLLTVAARLGYPDGFALSNQMYRLVGVRPVVARRNLGWEWLLEAWLHREAMNGGVSKQIRASLLAPYTSAPGEDRRPGHRSGEPPSTLTPPRRSAARVPRRAGRTDR